MSLRASVPASEAIPQFWRGDCFAKSARNDILRIAVLKFGIGSSRYVAALETTGSRRFVISTSAAPVCHFDERSEEKSSHHHSSQVSRCARNDRLAPVCHFDQRSANLSFRPAQRGEIFSASFLSGFSLRSKRQARVNLSFRRAQRQFVISTGAASICHFDERSEEKSSHHHSSAGFSLRSKRQARVNLSFRPAQRQFVISTSAARRNLLILIPLRFLAALETTGSRQFVISTSAASICHFDERSEEKSSHHHSSQVSRCARNDRLAGASAPFCSLV